MKFNSPKLYPWQYDTLVGIRDHWKACTHVVVAPRQCGKSVMLEQLVLMSVCKGWGITYLMSPSFKQSTKIYNELLRALVQTPLYKSSNSSSMVIVFSNDYELHFISAEQSIESLQGFTVAGTGCLIVDEAAFCSDDKITTCLPYVDVHQCPVIFTSTPLTKHGLFYETYMLGLGNTPNIYTYDWSEGYNLTLIRSEEKMEYYRKTLPAYKFRSMYLGKFLDSSFCVFANYDNCVVSEYHPASKIYAGIDWSSTTGKGDFTAVSVLNDHRQMTDLVYWNEGDATDNISKIVDIFVKDKVAVALCETNSMGKTNIDFLKAEIKRRHLNIQVRSFNTTNDTKREIIDELALAFQSGAIEIIKDAELFTELEQYQPEQTPTGKITYNAAKDYHDDLVISTALALKATKQKDYVIL